jgi:hypothetical protein
MIWISYILKFKALKTLITTLIVTLPWLSIIIILSHVRIHSLNFTIINSTIHIALVTNIPFLNWTHWTQISTYHIGFAWQCPFGKVPVLRFPAPRHWVLYVRMKVSLFISISSLIKFQYLKKWFSIFLLSSSWTICSSVIIT